MADPSTIHGLLRAPAPASCSCRRRRAVLRCRAEVDFAWAAASRYLSELGCDGGWALVENGWTGIKMLGCDGVGWKWGQIISKIFQFLDFPIIRGIFKATWKSMKIHLCIEQLPKNGPRESGLKHGPKPRDSANQHCCHAHPIAAIPVSSPRPSVLLHSAPNQRPHRNQGKPWENHRKTMGKP